MPIDLARSHAITAELQLDRRRAAEAPPEGGRRPAPKKAKQILPRGSRSSSGAEPQLLASDGGSTRASIPRPRSTGWAATSRSPASGSAPSELAVVSYHMGIGNLTTVIERYLGFDVGRRRDGGAARRRAARLPAPLLRLLAAGPRAGWSFLASLGDDSSTYLWRVLAAREIMRLLARGPEQLRELAAPVQRQGDGRGGLPPRGRDRPSSPTRARSKTRSTTATWSRSPPGQEYGFEVGRELGELADELGVDPRDLPLAAPGGAGDADLHDRAGARRSPAARQADRDQRGPRPALPGGAGRGQPRGDHRLLAAHDRLLVRHPARLLGRSAGARRSSSSSTVCGRWR